MTALWLLLAMLAAAGSEITRRRARQLRRIEASIRAYAGGSRVGVLDSADPVLVRLRARIAVRRIRAIRRPRMAQHG